MDKQSKTKRTKKEQRRGLNMKYSELNNKEKLLVNNMEYHNYKGASKKEYITALAFLINKHKK
jgi:hypothetical protein